jgi:hypothetical protein
MGGLTSGAKAVMDIKNSNKYLDIYQQYADQSALEHKQKQEDRDRATKPEEVLSGLADIADGGTKPLSFRTDGSSMPMNSAPAQESVALRPMTERPNYGMGIIKGYAQGGLATLDDGVFSGGVPPSSVGLSAMAQPQQPQPQQAQQAPEAETLTPQQRITKAMMTTDLLSNPDKLSKMQAFAELHGMGKAITPFLERAYTAKKMGMIDGAMQLMRGQVDDAIDSLSRGGVKLADRPEPADPNNPRLWKINIEGVGEKVMDIGNLLQTTLEPKDFLKHDLAKSESEGKRNVSDSAVKVNESIVRVNKAREGKLGAETRNVGKTGPLGSPGKGPRVVRTVETNQGIVAVMSDGTQKALTGSDGKPLFGASGQKVAATLVGKTLSPYGENGDIAGKVNELTGQLRGDQTPPPEAAPAPGQKKVLIFGKDFK